MKRIARKFNSTWGATLVICLTIVVSSALTATAATVINGKNIKKNTVASKQIKNGTIVKADLNKNLSVTGPQGPQGAKGDSGGTNVITRRVIEASGSGNFADRDVQCAAGEHLVGGGAGWAETDGDNEIAGTVSISVPADSTGDPAAADSVPTGWTAAGENTTAGSRNFHVYAVCAKP
jgi:hypothetical protein